MMGKGTLILTRRVNYVDYKVEGRGGGKGKERNLLHYSISILAHFFLMWET